MPLASFYTPWKHQKTSGGLEKDDWHEMIWGNSPKCDALRDLVPFVQFKKREKHPCRSFNFSKVAGNAPQWYYCSFVITLHLFTP